MKKTYIQPSLVSMLIKTDYSILAASGEVMPTTIIDDETANGNESLSRRNRNVWDDEEDEEDFWLHTFLSLCTIIHVVRRDFSVTLQAKQQNV